MHLMELFSAMQPGAEKPLKLKEKGIANFIIKNCSESLDAFQTAGAPLLRGLHGVAGLVFVGQSRTDGSRRPVDVPIDIQRAFDKKLSAAGFTALRSNSIFCSSSIAVAENYGVPYVIFPINGFTYAWSSLTEDFQDDIDPKLQRFTNSPC